MNAKTTKSQDRATLTANLRIAKANNQTHNIERIQRLIDQIDNKN